MSELLSDDEIIKSESVISEEELFRHTSILASPAFGGRFPGTHSETLTLSYLQEQAEQIGFAPGNKKDGSYLQKVPLVKMTSTHHPTLHFNIKQSTNNANIDEINTQQSYTSHTDGSLDTLPNGNSGSVISRNVQDNQLNTSTSSFSLSSPSEFMIFTSKIEQELNVIDSELVFVGYGVCSKQWDWNDYSHLDFTGKTIICLVNDPGYGSQEECLFNGNAMTYYGRWPYKFEEAGRQGAKACLVVHNTAAASYPWHVIENGRGNVGKSYYLLESGHKHKCCVEGWLSEDSARRIFQTAGLDFDLLRSQACNRAFKPISLGITMSTQIHHDIEKLESHNFIAQIEGSDPILKDECIVFTAHWDHLGQKGEDIYHGARDNALGCAALIEIGRAALTLPVEKRRRTIVILLTTCEEQILLGSLWYVANPIFPLLKTIACMNVDVMNTWGRTRDMSYSGRGFSDLDECVEKAAKRQKRTVTGEHTPETGMFYRSDHFPFAKSGVPSIYLKNGFDHVEKGKDWFKALYSEWVVECYHKPQDQVVRDPQSKWNWDLSGCVEDTKLLFDIACQLIDNAQPLHWKDGAEFKHVRIAHLKEGIHGNL